jgi:hypothetical protein
MRKIGNLMLGFIVMELLLSALPLNPLSTTANPFTEVTINLWDEPSEVDVSPGSSGIVVTSGTITCIKWGPDQVKVYLNGSSPFGSASVIPPDMVFGGSGGSEETRSFSVTTRIPRGTTSLERTSVTVGGYYVQGSMEYDIAPDTAQIIVMQFYRVEVYIKEGNYKGANLTARPGESVNLDVIIHNSGNGNDVFKIDFLDREDAEKDGIKLPKPFEVSVPEKRNKSVSLEIGSEEPRSGIHFLMLSVSSKGSEDSDRPFKIFKPIILDIEEQSITDKIGSIMISPLIIGIVVLVVLVGIVFKIKS